MITSCLGVLVQRGGLLLVLTASLPTSLFGQVDSTVSSTVMLPRRENGWISVGVGVGKEGVAGAVSAWYSNNNFVLGAHAAGVADGSYRDVHDVALLLGVRDLTEGGHVLIAAGPARLGGKHYVDNGDPRRSVPMNELGIAIAAEAIINLSVVGFGVDAFIARSRNRLVQGIVLSVQVGWLGISLLPVQRVGRTEPADRL